MSNLIAVAYPDVETAQSVAAELGQLMTEQSITLDDLVVIERRPDGKVKLHQAGGSTAARGAAGGALWGGLIGLIFLVPVLGIAVGAAAGAAGGAVADPGVNDNFMKELGDMKDGGAAVVVLVRESTPDKVLPRIAKYGGEVIQSSLDNETEAQLDAVLAGRGAAA